MNNINEITHKEITEYCDESQAVYGKQNFHTSGKYDVEYILMNGKTKSSKELSENLMELLYRHYEGEFSKRRVEIFLNTNKFIHFYFDFKETLRDNIREKIIDNETMYKIGEMFCTKENSSNLIKLGITIICLCNGAKSRGICEKLGVISEYTLYIVDGLKNETSGNSFIFNLAKRTYGYGKLICLHELKPINEEIKTWMIEEGYKNVVHDFMHAIIIINNVEIASYLKSDGISSGRLKHISTLLFLALRNNKNDIYNINNSVTDVEYYLECVEKYGESFEDLATVCHIEGELSRHWSEPVKDIHNEKVWTRESINRCKNLTVDILKNLKWIEIFKKGLAEGNYALIYYLNIARKIDIELNYNDVKRFLEKDPYNIDVYYYVCERGVEEEIRNLIEFSKNTIPIKDICGEPENIEDDNLLHEHRADICLMYIIKALKSCGHVDDYFPLSGVLSRINSCRKEALSYIRKNELHKIEIYRELLDKALLLEPNEKIKRTLRWLLKKDKPKVCKYVDVDKQRVSPCFKDIYMFSTTVAGAEYRDLSIVESSLLEGSLLFLKREPENLYDDKAILITTEEGYVLGYVPRGDNFIPKNLIDGGKYLYAKAKHVDIKKSIIDVRVYLSYRDVIEELDTIMRMMGAENTPLKS